MLQSGVDGSVFVPGAWLEGNLCPKSNGNIDACALGLGFYSANANPLSPLPPICNLHRLPLLLLYSKC